MSIAQELNTVRTSAPIDTDSAGRLGDIATNAVIRLLCLEPARSELAFFIRAAMLYQAADGYAKWHAGRRNRCRSGSRSRSRSRETSQSHQCKAVGNRAN